MGCHYAREHVHTPLLYLGNGWTDCAQICYVSRDRYMWLRQSNWGVSARAQLHNPPLFRVLAWIGWFKVDDCGIPRGRYLSADMARASYSATPLLRSLVHRPQGVILVLKNIENWNETAESRRKRNNKVHSVPVPITLLSSIRCYARPDVSVCENERNDKPCFFKPNRSASGNEWGKTRKLV